MLCLRLSPGTGCGGGVHMGATDSVQVSVAPGCQHPSHSVLQAKGAVCHTGSSACILGDQHPAPGWLSPQCCGHLLQADAPLESPLNDHL